MKITKAKVWSIQNDNVNLEIETCVLSISKNGVFCIEQGSILEEIDINTEGEFNYNYSPWDGSIEMHVGEQKIKIYPDGNLTLGKYINEKLLEMLCEYIENFNPIYASEEDYKKIKEIYSNMN